MKKLIIALLFLSLFACKKEDNTTSSQTTTDSVIYYNKWTKLNKVNYNYVGNFSVNSITDISLLPNKSVILLTSYTVGILDSNYNLSTSQSFFNTTANNFKLSRTSTNDTIRSRFYYIGYLVSGGTPMPQVFYMNYINNNSLVTNMYTRSYFIKDTSFSNTYYVIGHDYDYFAYHFYKSSEKAYYYLLNYFDNQKNINKTIEFSSETYLPKVFKLGNTIVFQSNYGNIYASVDLNTFYVVKNDYVIDFRLIGNYKGETYFNHTDKGIYKSTSFNEYKKVFQHIPLVGEMLPFFGGKYLLYNKRKSNIDYSNDGLILFDLDTYQSKTITWDYPYNELPLYYWVNGNVLYILTNGNIYAKKF